jgi:hypothetical protein
MTRSSLRSMACSFCAMVAQELDQLMVSTVLERSTKAVVAMKFLGFVRQHPVHGPGHLRACLCDFQEYMPATGPRADRGRAKTRERPRKCIDLGASSLAPSYLASPGSWRLGLQNLAHFAILPWPAPPPPIPHPPL